MSNEGGWILSRVAIGVVLILLAAAMRTMIGGSKRRGQVVMVATLAGLTLGVVTAVLLSSVLNVGEESALFAVGGILLGWAAAWILAQRIPRTG